MVRQYQVKLIARPKGFHLITTEILEVINQLPQQGLLNLFIQHTSAGICIGENADRSVREDLDKSFDYLAPVNQNFYTHTYEGSDDMPAHIKTILSGNSLTIPITMGKLNLGTWQGIYLCEFRESAIDRKLIVTVVS